MEGRHVFYTTSMPDADWFSPWQEVNSPGLETDESLLLRETHHRMMNTLTMLTSWLRRDLPTLNTAEFRDSLARYEGRIVAFDELHRLLAVGAGDGNIELGNYIAQLGKSLAGAVLEPIGIRCEVSIEDGSLARKQCERLGLVITELVTNAAKHAFKGRGHGLIRIEMSRPSGWWRCTLFDNGTGISAGSSGMGSRILNELVGAMGGKIIARSDPDGTAVTVVLPS
jgi:two-component sensor histidine kinase